MRWQEKNLNTVNTKESNMNKIYESYIRLYDNVFDEEFCSNFIDDYERVMEYDFEKVRSLSFCHTPEGNKMCPSCNCTRVNIMEHDSFSKYTVKLLKNYASCILQYRKDCNLTNAQISSDANSWGWEEFKIKRYKVGEGLPTDEQFTEHVDVNSHAGAKRYLIGILYLNENFTGGETDFIHHGITLTPKTGSLLIFPPLWTYLHRGLPIKGGSSKYICITYLNYPDMASVDYAKNPLAGTVTSPNHGSMAAKTLGYT